MRKRQVTGKYFFRFGMVLFPGCYLFVGKKCDLLNTMSPPSVGESCACFFPVFYFCGTALRCLIRSMGRHYWESCKTAVIIAQCSLFLSGLFIDFFFKDTRGTASAHIIDFANKSLYFDGTFHWKIINCSIRLTVSWDGNVSCCLDGKIDLDGFLWFLNSYWERAQNQMPHLCSSLSH